ncbi:transmembrane amino acid transporter protein-domain-containing protein [Syncephalastrum racemosum]|uniref:Transmembrane amino acid transporter protein-domain-containing protein n=1 Tax=Syncephalastrum racemosum TaxID=13706 RepID=A0A1X2HPG8_SYNRA|nr:transmembrane amino acid transporter protein-domain-containing protein [Syncephalastrum racemosum]
MHYTASPPSTTIPPPLYGSTSISSTVASSMIISSDEEDDNDRLSAFYTIPGSPTPSMLYGDIPRSKLDPAEATQSKADLQALQADRPGYGTSSVFGSSMNLLNAMMGSGIIGLPLALYLCGFWLGLISAVVVAILTCIAMHLLVLCGIRSRQYTLGDLCRACLLGEVGSHIVNFLLFFHTAGTAVSYYILLGDTVPCLLRYYVPDVSWLGNRQIIVISFGVLCSLPLTLPRSIAPLAKWSAASVLLLPMVVLGIFIRLPLYAPSTIELTTTGPTVSAVFRGLSILCLSFGCSQNVLGVYLSQRDQRPGRFLIASETSIFLGFLINMSFAVLGFLCFGDAVQANVLLNFPEDDPVINSVRLFLGIFMCFTIPLSIYPCREALQKLLGLNTHGKIPSTLQHYLTTLVAFAVILYLGATLTALGKVYAVIGGFSTTALGILLPGAAYISCFWLDLIGKSKLTGDSQATLLGEEQVPVKGSWCLMMVASILVVVSFPVMYYAIMDAFIS